MSQQELLKKVVDTLDLSDIDHMITGSVASSLQGEPRSSPDIDVVIAIRAADVETLAKAEDTILAKLQWAVKSGGSEKQFADALSVFEVQHGNLDLDYLSKWALALGVEEMWRQLQDAAEVV